jgi:hypothetical protein
MLPRVVAQGLVLVRLVIGKLPVRIATDIAFVALVRLDQFAVRHGNFP